MIRNIRSLVVSAGAAARTTRALAITRFPTPAWARPLLAAFAAISPVSKMSARNHAPSADRNKEPIAAELRRFFPFSETKQPCGCLEIASGTGQHCAHFAAQFPHVKFQPTEYVGGSSGPEAEAYGDLNPVFASIAAWTDGLPNVAPPIELDAAGEWPGAVAARRYDAVYACNICHISPYAVSEGLLAGAAAVLAPGGRLFVYGPFMLDGRHTAPSNEAFDARLRAQNPAWGVRDARDLAALATARGLALEETLPMPANNFVLVFARRRGDESGADGASEEEEMLKRWC